MKFIPRKARDDVNVSPEHPLFEAATLTAALGLALAVGMVLLLYLVDLLLWLVPREQEIRMFEAWLPENIATVAVDDPRLETVEHLLDRLLRHWPDATYPFRVEIDDSPAANAIAYPGGLILVTSGLLEQAGSENELAFILGHELGHFRNRDHLRGLGRGAVLAILFTALTSGDNSVALGSSLANLTLSGFSRSQETSADRFGLALVHAEYGHVRDAWRFFDRLQEGGRPAPLAAYLSTHPAPDRRIRKLAAFADEQGWVTTGPVTPLEWRQGPG